MATFRGSVKLYSLAEVEVLLLTVGDVCKSVELLELRAESDCFGVVISRFQALEEGREKGGR